MSKKKYCYQFTEHRIFKCCDCGRTMHEKVPHVCNGQYRKHNLRFSTLQDAIPNTSIIHPCEICAKRRYCKNAFSIDSYKCNDLDCENDF